MAIITSYFHYKTKPYYSKRDIKPAVYALGEIKTEKAVEMLIQALNDKNYEVHDTAAHALGEIKSEKSIEPLIKAIKGGGYYVPDAAAWALGEIYSKVK